MRKKEAKGTESDDRKLFAQNASQPFKTITSRIYMDGKRQNRWDHG